MAEVNKTNEHGEKFFIKIDKEDRIVWVRHDDIDDKYHTLNDLFVNYILSNEEILAIYSAVRQILVKFFNEG